jgi:YD repeat-containing protein
VDDSVASVEDARGAVTHFAYNGLGLVEQISYTVPEVVSSIPDPADITFTYDDLGNRTGMTDGLGSIAYEYNELSQLTGETRDFTDNLPNAPTGGVFALEYTYTRSGQLKSLKDPFGQQFNYTHDKAGRLEAVAGSSSWAGITTYAGGATYSARGTLTGKLRQWRDHGDNRF